MHTPGLKLETKWQTFPRLYPAVLIRVRIPVGEAAAPAGAFLEGSQPGAAPVGHGACRPHGDARPGGDVFWSPLQEGPPGLSSHLHPSPGKTWSWRRDGSPPSAKGGRAFALSWAVCLSQHHFPGCCFYGAQPSEEMLAVTCPWGGQVPLEQGRYCQERNVVGWGLCPARGVGRVWLAPCLLHRCGVPRTSRLCFLFW